MSENGNDTIKREDLREKLEALRKQRETMLEQMNRQLAQIDGAVGFLEQLLDGELDPVEGENLTEEIADA